MAQNKWSRGVSIIGGGMSHIGNLAVSPYLKGMSERDLLSWAVLGACEDAGIEPKDIDASALGQTDVLEMRHLVMGQTLHHLLGAETKPCHSIVMGCASGVACCDIIANKIASGQIDIGLVAGIATPVSTADAKPDEYRKHPGQRVVTDEWMKNVGTAFDQAYWEHTANASFIGAFGFQVLRYMKRYGLTFEQMDDTLNTISILMREAAVNHPMSQHAGGKTYEDLAKENGHSGALDYLRDPMVNMPIGANIRALHMPALADGAGAIILCATEIADEVSKKKPIALSGIGQGASVGVPPGSDMRYVTYAEDGAKRQCYEMADLKDPAEIEYLGIHDPCVFNHLGDAELTGYARPGETWKLVLQGETRFDGRKPIQTQGGETQWGDCNDGAAVVDIFEAIQQMRGECGKRQMPTPPKCAVVVGRGIHSIGMMVLRDRT